MEVKVGVDGARELTLNSGQSQEEVEKLVAEALGSTEGNLRIDDDKGTRYIVPSAKITYVEIGATGPQRVGFGVG
ncbi:DUF3107 domain-containing protein [Actinopolyspora erythraea]|uniref:ATP-binding protein n=1 Tax=Actinopolyspora erythraea TaxID=414996 RepID=A0A099D2L4_9ACTN|nr:DUF3107 domain-containing protein [Actinopolyspora erythraea]ASU79748.1 DUF3107 domain-containing protein [Actinopolyspora erythraea]KGI79530.1 ATP-binding protein [Actinopolyspora erythraea]